ncbi:MAG: hypothetical protein A2V66_10215 [Ignavibacteria bacterium RBG_13_36_8]|nr:MAG: hypothetical protein A2V66_10215 [Ignavibacteria bacterium RBG_13_36_8]
MEYKIDFDKLNSESPFEGISHKYFIHGDTKLRLVEYGKNMPPHWCSKGHIGYVLEGEMEIEFANEKILFRKGDGVFIPGGDEHKHKGVVITEKAVMVFVEEA